MLNVSRQFYRENPQLKDVQDLPIRAWQEHSREVFSVDWSNIKKDTFASSSWDGNVKLVSLTNTTFPSIILLTFLLSGRLIDLDR
jgi:WD40 repeat protein